MFKTISAENLFSWANLNYEVPKGISQIIGHNLDDKTSEGSGKSAIFNTLCWVLYGKIPKTAKLDEVIKEGETYGKGSVTFANGSKVVRSRRPNDLFILKEGKELRGKDSKETQGFVETLVGLSFDTFCQSIYFPQNYEKKFITANESDKVKILSEIQNLEVFDKASKAVTLEIKGYLEKITTLKTKKTLLETQVENQSQTVENYKELLESFEASKSKSINRLDKQLTEISELMQETQDAFNKLSTKNPKRSLEKIKGSLQKLTIKEESIKQVLSNNLLKEQKKESLLKQINLLKTQECPTCGNLLSSKDSGKLIEELEKEVDQIVIKNLDKAELSKLEQTRQALLKEELDLIKEQSNLDKSSKYLEDFYKIEKDLKIEKEQLVISQSYKEKSFLEEALKTYKELEEELQTTSRKLEVLEGNIVTLEVLKKGFKEVKSMVFSNLLMELSVKSNQYLQKLFEVPINIRFYNETEEGNVGKILTEVALSGKSRPLGLYSGGQLQRIKLAVDLAISDIVSRRLNKTSNFRILDEPFKNLSQTSMEKAVELLRDKEGSTIIIEHNQVVNSIVDNTFNINFKDGCSYAV